MSVADNNQLYANILYQVWCQVETCGRSRRHAVLGNYMSPVTERLRAGDY